MKKLFSCPIKIVFLFYKHGVWNSFFNLFVSNRKLNQQLLRRVLNAIIKLKEHLF